jgi:hypothetical protein
MGARLKPARGAPASCRLSRAETIGRETKMLIGTVPGDCNTQAEIHQIGAVKFSVVIRDLDTGESLNGVTICKTLEQAQKYADRVRVAL